MELKRVYSMTYFIKLLQSYVSKTITNFFLPFLTIFIREMAQIINGLHADMR
jgi:hypothetical protein